MDHIDPICPFDASAYTGVPDSEPTCARLDVPALIRQLDGLYNGGREAEAGAFLYRQRARAAELGDWRTELSLLSELLGYHRRDKDEERALAAIRDALDMIRAHRLGGTVSGATVMLNAATTLKCFGRARESLPYFEHAARVYAEHLDPTDYRYAGLYNNMALSYEDLGEYPRAEQYFSLALRTISRCEAPDNEMAVTFCNLAELYDRQDPEDARIGECMEKAWEHLNAPGLPRDGYHAFTLSKCIPSFDYFGFFLYAKELRERMAAIHERT